MPRILKICLFLICFCAFTAAISPWLLYQYGLSNITVLPKGADYPPLTTDEKATVLKDFRVKTFIMSVALNPWTYFFTMQPRGFDKLLSDEERSKYILAFVALRYNGDSHLKNSHGLSWHFSGAALAIWLANHWTDEQILSQAHYYLWKNSNYRTCGNSNRCPKAEQD